MNNIIEITKGVLSLAASVGAGAIVKGACGIATEVIEVTNPVKKVCVAVGSWALAGAAGATAAVYSGKVVDDTVELVNDIKEKFTKAKKEYDIYIRTEESKEIIKEETKTEKKKNKKVKEDK